MKRSGVFLITEKMKKSTAQKEKRIRKKKVFIASLFATGKKGTKLKWPPSGRGWGLSGYVQLTGHSV